MLVALALAASNPSARAVDPALVGTWKLDYPGAAIFWVVRPDGTYRLHGPGARPRQFGRMESGRGRWSVKADVWADEGTYKLAGAKTWIVTGKYGTATWKQVWKPAEGSPKAVSGAGACRLATPSEISKVLYSPGSGREDNPNKAEGCRYYALFSNLDDLRIAIRDNQGGFFENVRKGKGSRAMDVPAVGDRAFTELSSSGALTLQFLKGSRWVTLDLRLQPTAVMEDLPYLVELGRAIAGRL